MKKAFVIILSVLLFISIFVSCDSDNIIDEMFGFVVTFNANGGTGTMEPQRFTTEGGKLNPNTFTKTDYVFSKWNTSADGTGTDYADGQNIKSSSDITLYAQWKLASIVLTPDTTDWVDGKSYTIENDLTITERVTITGNVTLVLPDGKTLTSSSGITVGEGSTLSITTYGTEGTGKLIATGGGGSAAIGGMNESGKKNAGTIIIDGVNVEARGGEGGAGIGGAYQGSGGNITISGEDTLVTATAGSGSGVEGIGKGESGSASGTLTIGEGQGLYGGPDKDNMDFLSGPTESYAGVRTAYMEATATEFVTVSFNANGGSGTMDPQSVRSGVDTTLDANEFTHATLSFGGWALTSGGEAVYSDQGTINVSDDTTLYATWIDVIYLSSDMTTIEGGKKYSIVEYNLTIPNRLSIDGTEAATIVLPAGKTLTLEKGINVESGKSLIIDGSGSLISTAEEGSGDAGIGGAYGASGGTITIKGGTITAIGASGSSSEGGGAGIGGGHNGSGGTVIISGGSVTANGGAGASMGGGGAGIGSGNNGNALGSVSGGTITISGGTVNATGGASDNNRYGAGLGGGNYSNGATVSITGGTVKATSGAGVGAIGAGCGSSSHGSLAIGAGLGLYGGADKDHADFLSAPTESYTGARPVYMETKATTYVTVTFNANGGTGTMDAQSVPKDLDVALNANVFEKTDKYFAGWNTKSDGSGDSYSDKGSINIGSDTTLYAQWTDGVPLDDSYGGEGKKLEGGQKYTIFDDLILSGRLGISGLSNVTIVLPKDKTLTLCEGISVIAGQGLTIEGKGSLIATGSADSAAIGGINANAGGTVTINGGIITATGGSRAAGIGGGYGANGGTVTLNGGTVTATGGEGAVGIGKGQGGTSDGTLKIGGGMGLYGGTNKDSAVFISAPVDSYAGTRHAYMTAKATTSYVTLTFNANGGSGTMEAQSVPSGENAYLSDNKFESANIFVGWALTSDGDVAYSNQGIINVKANTTLYAKWIAEVVTLTGGETTLEGGKNYTISDNTTFSGERLSLDTTSGGGPVTLVLPKDKTLTLNKGISVLSGQTLIIMGEGKLIANAESGSGNAAIGATKGVAGGDVKIYGGIITATGARRGAGIGGGDTGEPYWERLNKSGNIYIYGGKVTATGGDEAAGIGSGDYGVTQTIVISGGEVTAQGGGGSAGIGDGYESSGANVTITGGIVKAGGYPSGIRGSLKIGDGLCLFGGGVFLSGPVDSYSGNRPGHMETKAADLVTITFNANGGTGTMPDQTAASGYAVKLNANAFTNGDWYFGGWASTKTGDIEYENKASITVDANTTLYAKWVDAIPISSSTSVLEGGSKYTILADVTNNNRLSINGTEAAIIDLPDGMTLTLTNGINVSEGKSLTIQGKGTLTATGDEYNAGIGGNERQTAGTITIKGGFVNATGSKWGGAGIGGGGGSSRDSDYYRGGDGGTINILGGTVTATGGYGGGAGIGGGSYAKEGGTISIEGGSVTALSVSGAAAIGGGAYGCNGGTITISGKDTIVDATGGADAGAGIGGGKEGGAGGTITISGGTVTARGGESAYTSGGGAAGIGGGSGSSSYPGGAGGTITISGGDVTAIGNKNAAGIGGGGSFSDTKGGAGGTVNITGGTVKATGGSGARGIGKGSGKNLATDGVLIIGDNVGLYGGSSQSDEKFLTKPTNSWPDDLDHRPIFMDAKPTDYVTVSFDGNGGEGEMTSQLMVKDFAFYDLSANAFTTPTEGLIFTGWATSKDGIVVYSDEGTIAFSEDVTLYAQWGTDVVITDSLKKLVAEHNHIYYGDVTNGNRLYISGGDSATITLTEGKTLNLNQGINVPNGKTLTINGNGTMNATGGTNQAGIGGGNKEYGGSIIINGGTITARGGGRAAGIGAGGASNGDYGYTAGELIVNGGNVTAYGGNDGGAGIGGGRGPSLTQPGAGGTVTINDGIVTAYGGSFAAGIGGGPATTGRTTIILTVNGGSVTATGNGGGAGIGGFKDYAGGIVTINGGTVTAAGSINVMSDSGMGIGHGSSSQGGSTDNGKLTIGFAESQTNTLAINEGWSLYYGDTENPTAHVDGPHSADDIDSYAKRYMNVSEPVTP